jgi:hypothetical protein
MSEFGSAFDSPFETEETGAVASLLGPLEEAYNGLFQFATWILPVWVTRSEFVFLLAAVGILVGWTVSEFALAVPFEQLVPAFPTTFRRYIESGVSLLGVGFGGALIFLTLLERLPTGSLLGGGLGLIVLGVSNHGRPFGMTGRLSVPIRLGLSGAAVALAVGLTYEATSGRHVTFHYLGLAVLLVLGSFKLWPRNDGV